MFDFDSIEHPFLFSDHKKSDISDLSPVDYARLVRILVRARYARAIGVTIPMEILLAEQPL